MKQLIMILFALMCVIVAKGQISVNDFKNEMAKNYRNCLIEDSLYRIGFFKDTMYFPPKNKYTKIDTIITYYHKFKVVYIGDMKAKQEWEKENFWWEKEN